MKDDGVSKSVDKREYQSLVGSLLYAAIATRSDISYSVGVVARYCANPNQSHLTAPKRVHSIFTDHAPEDWPEILG